MSGPKITVYALTARQKQILLGQARCARNCAFCRAEAKKSLGALRSLLAVTEKRLENIRLLCERTGEGKEREAELTAACSRLRSEAEELAEGLSEQKPVPFDRSELTEKALADSQAREKRTRALMEKARKLEAEANAVCASAEGDSPRGENGGDGTVQKIRDSIASDLGGVYSFDAEDDGVGDGFGQRKDELLKKLSGYLEKKSLPGDLARAVRSALGALEKIDSARYLRDFESVTVAPLLKRIDAFFEGEKEKLAAFEERVSRYEALCEAAGEKPKRFPYSESGEKQLEEETERLEEQIVRRREQEYVSECVDEVLEEMGYELIGSREVRKKSGKRFRNELFDFSEGKAVSVTFSSDGQISMELGVLAREDRIPTEEESADLVSDMESFCGEFAVFEKKMLERGIVVGSRIALCPPSAEYAVVINEEDYDMSPEAREKATGGGKKTRRRTAKKAVKREKRSDE